MEEQSDNFENKKRSLSQGDSANIAQTGSYNSGNNHNIVNVNNEVTWCEKSSRYHRGQHNDDQAKKAKKVFKMFKRDDEKEKLSAKTVEKPAKKGDSTYKELKSELKK